MFVRWCFTSLQQRGHLETAPPFTVPCEGREARWIHRSHRESNPGSSRGSPLHYCCATQAPWIRWTRVSVKLFLKFKEIHHTMKHVRFSMGRITLNYRLRLAFHWRGCGPHGRVKEWCAISQNRVNGKPALGTGFREGLAHVLQTVNAKIVNNFEA